MMIDWEIIKKSVFGTLGVRERQALEQWLGESERHWRFYENVRRHYAEPIEPIGLNVAELDAAWSRFTLHARRRSGRLTGIRIAAAVAAVLIAAVCVWTLNIPRMPSPQTPPQAVITAGTTRAILSVGGGEKIHLSGGEQDGEWKKFVAEEPAAEPAADSEPAAPENIRIEIPKGGEYRLQLPDGTMVWLNSQTVIEYPSAFVGGRRAVRLVGEAFFEVAHDAARPFAIATPDRLEITVLGTRFNVSSYQDVDRAQVTLVEGSVSVSDGAARLTLRPNQQAVFDRAERTLSLHEVEDAEGSCAWTHGVFDFKLQPLETILGAVSKWYDIEIVYDPAEVRRFEAITLQCDRRSDFTHVMEILQKVTALNYRAEGKSVYITF